ncbi:MULTISPECIES: right-handed parallel beta-helix repeat-containing protein [Niastella]|uniref:Right-handed parallel beta-helix repeat-containing protein n=1 Tax=Niastella soli TaxID=2821487 RepID=A0ABS3Z1W7_9BACT|nr:right-handed parallel beta-helix repeat-containing protein [Niastella soli]MBO9204157.1 right-handed parallel beta-helix repeat-containing protein [Niastella soli]
MNTINIKHLIIPTIALALAACHKEEMVDISPAKLSAGQAITSDTLTGSVKGVLQSGRTYYFRTDITVNAGDTLLMMEGSKLIALGDGKTTATSPQITCNGTFISLGTPNNHNFITVPDAQRNTNSVGKGLWGGIQCGDKSGDLIIKWTHLEFAGGPAGPAADPGVYAAGDPRYTVVYTNINGNCIFEDNWIYGSTDDGMRVLHGHVSIMRNTYEANGKAGGEAVNIKNGTLGDIAYNLAIGAATNGFKVSNSGDGPVQTNVNVYNNTMINCGFRQVKSGRGGSINFEKGAQGKIFNNMIINCRFGLRVTSDADGAHITYNNQFYYANDQRMINQFNASDGVAKTMSGDIRSTTPGTNNPQFAQYDVNQFDYTKLTFPMDITAMPFTIITAGSYNFGLLPGSPALKKANADLFQPMKSVPQSGTYGATTLAPGVDMGAYQSDGSGNLHYASSLSFN